MKKIVKSYSKFTADDIEDLGLKIIQDNWLQSTQLLPPSTLLTQLFAINLQLPLYTEKAKSELIITPILNEIWVKNRTFFTIYSGYNFEVDKTKGLNGFCDYLFAKMPASVFINTPVIAVIEAKNEQDLPNATPQCVAEMYAAYLFNEKRKQNIPIIYGVITSGFEWMFLKLDNRTASLDTKRYFFNQLPELLGALQTIIDLCK
jgi:type I site-specific restriction endonuclease